MASALLQGFGFGLAIAAAPGPVFLLCVRRTLSRGWLSGAISGLGVATADGFYGALAGFGVGALTTVLLAQSRWIGLAGGLFLSYLGVRSMLARPRLAEASARAGGAGDYLSALGLTLGNPPTILSFLALFAGLGLRRNPDTAGLLVAGILLGSAAWWLALATVVSRVRRRLDGRVARWLSILSGAALTGFGVVAIGSALLR